MYNLNTAELPAQSFTISAFMFLMLISGPNLAYTCCTEEEQPISDCSFSYNNNQETVLCEIRGSAKLHTFDICHDGSTDETRIPGGVENMTIEPYYTTCSPTTEPSISLAASSCHTLCNHDNATVYLGLNITFKAEEWSSEDLEAISISLRRHNAVTLQCIQFDFGTNRLSKSAAANHYFYYDGFIGLEPGVDYTVKVMALPTDFHRSNGQSQIISIPPRFETCWKPDILYHDTPFAVNITFFQDVVYNFTRFDVSLGLETKKINFYTTELYEIDGKWGKNIIFECQQPKPQEHYLVIDPKECIYCIPYKIRVHIKAAPPSFADCPQTEISHEVKLGRYLEGDMVRGINWTVPTPIFQSKCHDGINSTHTPTESAFVVGRITPVTYHAWQYGSVAECTFNVHVKLVTENSVSLALKVGVSCAAGILLIIIVAIILYCVYSRRINNMSENPVPKINKSEVFCPISSHEEHGIPIHFLRVYPDSQLSLNSSNISGNQALKYPEITRQLKLLSSSDRYRSLPSMEHSSSGYMSVINTNSDNHPRHIGEENSTFLCRSKMNGLDKEECYSDDSREPDDEPGPMSMEYIS